MFNCKEQEQCLENVFTSDVEKARQKAVPESTHLVPQTFVDLQWFSIESHMFLLTDSEQRPALPAVHQPVMVYIGISNREKDINIYQTEQKHIFNSISIPCRQFFRATQPLKRSTI